MKVVCTALAMYTVSPFFDTVTTEVALKSFPLVYYAMQNNSTSQRKANSKGIFRAD